MMRVPRTARFVALVRTASAEILQWTPEIPRSGDVPRTLSVVM